MIDINFISPTGGIVKSVNGKTGRVELTAADIGAATQEYVDNAVGSIEIPDVDFTGYATEEYVAKKIAEAELAESDVDLSAYYTKSETDKAIKKAVDAIEIPETDLSAYATKSYVSTQIAANQPDLSDYATEEYVGKKIAEAQLAESDVDLSGYYTKSETDDAIEQAIAAIPDVDLSDYAKKSEIPSTTGLATETYVNEQIGKIEFPETDLSNYYTKAQTNAQIEANVPDMSLYATKTYVGNEIAKIDIPSTAGLATETFVTEKIAEAQLSGGDVDLSGYATEKYVDDAIAAIEHPTTDLSNYYNKQEVDAKIPDTSGFATTGYVDDQIAAIPNESIYIDDISLIQNEDGVVEVSGTWLEEQVSALITANLPASGEEVSY